MNRLTRPIRFLTLLLLALQCAVPAFVSVADGASARYGRNAQSHIEAVGDNNCGPVHKADCELCRFLTSTHCAPATAADAFDADAHARPLTGLLAPRTSASRHGFHSRAPPPSTV